jgi:hypothetical protein
MKQPGPDDRYRPLSGRRRILIVVLAIATAATVLLSLIYRPGGVERPPPAPVPDAERCAPGRSDGCVGGKVDVIVPPPAASR